MAVFAFILGLLALGVMRLIQALGVCHGTQEEVTRHDEGRKKRILGGDAAHLRRFRSGCPVVDGKARGTFRVSRRVQAFLASAFLVLALPNLGIAEDAVDDAIYNTSTPDGTVFYGPVPFTFAGATTFEIGIVAKNAYDAAAYVLGYDPNSEQFTPEVKALLSNAETGTSFYGFAQNFSHPNPAGGIWNPEFWTTASTLYGAWRTWRGEYTQTGKLAAQIALEAILNGGGSGGGVAPVEGVYYFDLSWNGCPDRSNVSPTRNYALHQDAVYDPETNTASGGSASYYYTNSYSGNSPVFPESMQVRISSNAFDGISPDFDQYDYLLLYNISSNYYGFCQIWQLPKGSYEVFETTNSEGHSYYNIRLDESFTYYQVGPSGSNWRCQMYMTDGVFYTVGNVLGGQSTTSAGTKTLCVTSSSNNGRGYFGFIDTGSAIPPTNWPEDEDVHIWKEPPVPWPDTPDDPVITDDPIFLPDPTMPIPTPENGPTYETADLSAVLDAMDRHCIHLQTAIYGATNRVWLLLSQKMTNDLSTFTTWLGSWFGTFITTFQAGLSGLETYLHDLAAWLAEQLDYTFTSSAYDDGSVVAWLKKIWAKLGTGPIVTRPDDPVADPIGIGDWLGSFFSGLLNDLKGLIDSILGEFGTDLETLVTKFPISIPWDVAIVLGALVAPPQVPHIEYPMYTVGMGGLEYVTDVVIDLSDWSDVMGVIRNFELLTFGGFLAMKTKHFMELMEGVDV